MKKVSIIGAGNVGGTTAQRVAESGLASVELIDIAESLALAKAFDLRDACYSLKKNSLVEASSDFSRMQGSDIIVVTAGFARKPGMTREDLLSKNSKVIAEVSCSIAKFSPQAIVIVVTNPLDVMTYVAGQATKFDRMKIFGMGSNLDSARFANLVARKLGVEINQVEALVIGSHGEAMLPLPRFVKVKGKPLAELLAESEIASLVEKTKQRGAEIVSLYGSGSAYYAPSAAIFEIVETIITGKSKNIPVSVKLDGEFGITDACLGVLARIGSGGIEKILDLDLTSEEKGALAQSAKSVKESIEALKLS